MLQLQQPALTVAEAEVRLGNRTVLEGLSLDLFAGELLGLLGPNGAGKTTLINCIAGRRQLDRGEISMPTRTAARLGIVPQQIALYPDLTVQQNIDVFGRLVGLNSRQVRQAGREALAWAKLEDRRRSLVQDLSGGMQRRINIVCSVLNRPEVLLLDEPTVGVDPQSREHIYTMLDDLLEQGTAVLLTTHQLDEAREICDRLAIVDHGKIIATGTFEELVENSLGDAQRVVFVFPSPVTSVPKPLQLSQDATEATALIPNAADQLPDLMAKLKRQGIGISRVTIDEPSLQNLFLQLTGKELRE